MSQLLQKLFGYDSQTMTLKKEIMGGITTFLTMSYIIIVNPALLSTTGMDANALFTTTILASIVATFIMALYAKLPFALAPGMGLNAFFAYTIVLGMGYTWQFALTAVFLEGLLFILLTLTGLRNKIVEAMPLSLQRSIPAGIGLFIAFIGLHNAGIISSNETTLVTLGQLHDPAVLLACIGILLTSVLLIRRITGAFLIGILVTAIIGIPLGITHITSVVSSPPSIAPIFCQLEWNNIFCIDMVICIMTMLFMDMFDTMGSLIGICHRAGYVREDGSIPRLDKAFMADAIGTAAGALLGTSTVSSYVESAAGVEAGGRSGLTSLVTVICFALSLFLAPLFLSIPAQATAPTLFLVGVMMMGSMSNIDFHDYACAIPCLICIIMMPLSCSISDGILLGLISWVFLHILSGRIQHIGWSTTILAVLFISKYIFL